MKNRLIAKMIKLSSCIVFLCVSLQGCASSKGQTIKYYSLNSILSEQDVAQLNKVDKSNVIGIRKINVPSVFDSQSIVYRVSDHEVVQTEKNKWVSSLKDQLGLSLVQQLRNHGLYGISSACGVGDAKSCHDLTIDVRDFSGSYKAQADVVFDWTYSTSNGTCRGTASAVTKMQGTGYDALVSAMDVSWKDAISQMVEEIKLCSHA